MDVSKYLKKNLPGRKFLGGKEDMSGERGSMATLLRGLEL